MVYAIELLVSFPSSGRRNTVRTALENRLGQLSRWGIDDISTVNIDGRSNSLLVTARFVSEADRDAFWAELDSRLGTGGIGPIAGSRARRHNCTHDESPPQPCVVAEERVW